MDENSHLGGIAGYGPNRVAGCGIARAYFGPSIFENLFKPQADTTRRVQKPGSHVGRKSKHNYNACSHEERKSKERKIRRSR